MSSHPNNQLLWNELINQALSAQRWFSETEPSSVEELRKAGSIVVPTIIRGIALHLSNPPDPGRGHNFWAIAALCRLLGEFQAVEAVPILKALAAEQTNIYEYRELRPSTILALGQIGDKSVLPTLRELRKRRDLETVAQSAILKALEILGEPVHDASALLTQLLLGYTRREDLTQALQLIEQVEPRVNELSRDERGDFWFARAYIARNFEQKDQRLREYCIRSLAEFLERDLLWDWLGIKDFRTEGILLELIAATPGLEDLQEKIQSGGPKPQGFTTTLFFFLTNSVTQKEVIRRVPVDEWAQLAREAMQTPDADVIVFDYNEWECPTFHAIEQEAFDQLQEDVHRGIVKALVAYGIPENVASRLSRQASISPNTISQRLIMIVKHVNYAVDASPILQAIQEYPRTEAAINGRVIQAWTGLCQRGVRLRLKSFTFVRRFNFGQDDRIVSLAMIPVGQVALVGYESGAIGMFDFAASRPWGWYLGHKGQVRSIAVSNDSRFALSGGQDKSVQLWELDTRYLSPLITPEIISQMGSEPMVISKDAGIPNVRSSKWAMHQHRGPVNAVAISPDANWGLSGSEDHNLFLWELKTGRRLRVLSGHSGAVSAVTFSPDGSRAISGSEDHTIRIWDLSSGKCISTLKGHEKGVRAFAVINIQRRGCLLSGDAEGKFFLWNLDTGERLLTLKEKAGGLQWDHAGAIRAIAVLLSDARKGLLVASRFSGGQDCILVGADLMSGTPLLKEPHDGYVTGVAISPDGHFLLSGSEDRALRLWRLEWEYEFPRLTDWDDSARPYLENFITMHRPYAASLPATGNLSSQQSGRAMTREGVPAWSEDDFQLLLYELGNSGFGWLQPEGVRNELEHLKSQPEFITPPSL